MDIIFLIFNDSKKEFLFGILYFNTYSDYMPFILNAFKYCFYKSKL